MALVVLVTLIGGYLGLCGLLFALQRTLLFPAPTALAPVRTMRRVEVPGGTYLLLREAPGDGPVVVHFHGNGEQVAHLAWLGEAWAERGVSFAAVEYPGYPGAPGAPTETSLLAAAQAALTHLTSVMKIDRSRIVLEGQSVGTGVAVAMAAGGWGTRLVLLSPYTSLPDIGARVLPMFPVRLLMRDVLDSRSRAADVKIPTLIVHGTHDEVVPFDLGQALSTAIVGARFFPAQGGHHNDLWDQPGVTDAIFDFVSPAR